MLLKRSGGVRAAGFGMSLAFISFLGRWCFLQMCDLVSCPEQVLCPKRNQLNILRQKVETRPPSASPPPPSPVYDVSTRIALHPCVHVMVQPLLSLTCHGTGEVTKYQYCDVKQAVGLVLVILLLCSAPLGTVHVARLHPDPSANALRHAQQPCSSTGGQEESEGSLLFGTFPFSSLRIQPIDSSFHSPNWRTPTAPAP